MSSLFSARRVLLVASLLVVAAVGGSACTRNVGLVLAVDSNVSVPDNIDEVGIVLTDANGLPFYSQTWRAKGSNPISLPAQMGVAPADTTIHMAVVGFFNGAPKIFREAIGRSPSDALAALQMGLDWEDWGSAELVNPPPVADAGAVKEAGSDGSSMALSFDPGVVLLDGKGAAGHTVVRINGRDIMNTCERGKTSVGGRCIDANFDAGKLPTYSEDLVYGGANRECFPRVACFENSDMVVERANVAKFDGGACVVDLADFSEAKKFRRPLPSEFSPASGMFNVGVPVAVGRIIAIDRATPGLAGGWDVDPKNAGRLVVPDAFCNGVKFGTKEAKAPPVLKFTRACATKTRKNPLCENTQSVKNFVRGGKADPTSVLPDAGVIIVDPIKDAGGLLPDAGGLLTTIPFREVPPPASTAPAWLLRGKTLAAIDLVAAPVAGVANVSDKLMAAITTSPATNTFRASAAVIDPSGAVASIQDSVESFDLDSSDTGGVVQPARLEASALGVSYLVRSRSQPRPTTPPTPAAPIPKLFKFAPAGALGAMGQCANDISQKETFLRATVQPSGRVLCVMNRANDIVLRLERVGATPAVFNISALPPFPEIVGAVGLADTMNPGTLVPSLWITVGGYTRVVSPTIPAETDFFTTPASTNTVAKDVSLHGEPSAGASLRALILTAKSDPAVAPMPVWKLWMQGTSAPELVGTPKLDPVQDLSPGLAATHHPYAVSADTVYFVHESDDRPSRLQLAQYAIRPTFAKTRDLEFEAGMQDYFAKIYSVAVTRVTVGGQVMDRVYIAASVASTSPNPGFKLWTADVKPL